METKICTKCGEKLSLDMFNKQSIVKSGHRADCRVCQSKEKKLYRQNNKEIIKEKNRKYTNGRKIYDPLYAKRYYMENKESIAKRQKENREVNKEKLKMERETPEFKKYVREYYRKNKKILYEKKKEYAKTHRDEINIIAQRGRNRRRNLPSTLTVEQWENIKIHFDNKCAYCGKELFLAQDHFLALSKGGEYTANNIIPSCKSCNSSKWNRDFFTWYKTYEFYSKTRESKILKFLNYKGGVQQLKII